MESLEWQKLASVVTPDPGKIPYEPNKHLFRKVAFDVFQLKSGPVDPLWILEEAAGGESYLVAQYGNEEDASDKSLESKGHWIALSDSDAANVTLLYKNAPIRRFASAEFGFDKEDVHLFRQALVEKLASDANLKERLLRELNPERRDALLSQFPELA